MYYNSVNSAQDGATDKTHFVEIKGLRIMERDKNGKKTKMILDLYRAINPQEFLISLWPERFHFSEDDLYVVDSFDAKFKATKTGWFANRGPQRSHKLLDLLTDYIGMDFNCACDLCLAFLQDRPLWTVFWLYGNGQIGCWGNKSIDFLYEKLISYEKKMGGTHPTVVCGETERIANGGVTDYDCFIRSQIGREYKESGYEWSNEYLPFQ